MKAHRIFIVIALSIVLAFPITAAAGTWKPTKPIKLIVPWGAGGSTDQVTRVCAGELEKPLGQTIVVVNQPGASGSIGTKNTLNAPRDGYTWTSGAAKDLGTYQVLGMIDSSIRDWHLFLNISLPQVVAVQASSPYKDFKKSGTHCPFDELPPESFQQDPPQQEQQQQPQQQQPQQQQQIFKPVSMINESQTKPIN